MKKQVSLIDFGAGNLHSVYKALKFIDVDAEIKTIKQTSQLVVSTFTDLSGRFAIILPHGHYYLLVSKSGYIPFTIDNQAYKKSNIIDVEQDDTSISSKITMETTQETLTRQGKILTNIYNSERILQVVIAIFLVLGLLATLISTIQKLQFIYYLLIYLLFVLVYLKKFKIRDNGKSVHLKVY